MFYIIGALFAIVIGVVLLVNVMGAGSGASNSSQVAEAVNEVNQIRTGVKALGYGHQFNTIDNDLLEVGGAMPPELIAGAIGAGDDLDSWGGAVEIQPYGSPVSYCFGVIFVGVPRAACIAMVSQLTSNCGAFSAWTASNGAGGVVGQTMDPGAAELLCGASSDEIQWNFND